MTYEIKPIDTQYNGYYFRSRLEARWAVFFDALGLEYQYEPEGFELEDGTRYLPDFWLPGLSVWVEVKPYWAAIDEHKMLPFMVEQRKLKNDVWIICGQPWAAFDNTCGGLEIGYEVIKPHVGDGWFSGGWMFVQCRRCSNISLEGIGIHFPEVDTGLLAYGICCTEKAGWASSPRLIEAYAKARQARFEHGERG